MSAAYGAGMGLGRALQDLGRAMFEDAQWKERRKLLAEEAMAQLKAQREQRREDLEYEASLRPPQESEVEEVGEDGQRFKVRRQWEPNFKQGGGQYRELARMPVMAEPDRRKMEAQQYGLEGDAATAYALTGRLPTDFGRHRLPGTVSPRKPAPTWRQVQAEDGSYVWQDLNAAPADKPLKAPPPYRERQGGKKKDEEDEDDLLAPKPKADKDDQPPVPGARKAPDGNWYVEKDGKFYMVEP